MYFLKVLKECITTKFSMVIYRITTSKNHIELLVPGQIHRRRFHGGTQGVGLRASHLSCSDASEAKEDEASEEEATRPSTQAEDHAPDENMQANRQGGCRDFGDRG